MEVVNLVVSVLEDALIRSMGLGDWITILQIWTRLIRVAHQLGLTPPKELDAFRASCAEALQAAEAWQLDSHLSGGGEDPLGGGAGREGGRRRGVRLGAAETVEGSEQ